MRILLVEDDPLLSDGLAKALKRQGFTLCIALTGREALVAVQFENIDIVILDLGLPDIDGLTVLEKIRQFKNPPPVLILTARDQLEDKISGLEKGADDYLVKPFELDELVARLKVFERRLTSSEKSLVKIGLLQLDISGHNVIYDSQPLDLSKKEYLVLKALMESAGRIVTKDALEARIYSVDDEVASNALEVHVHNLRKKTDKSIIKTIRGIGYSMSLPESEPFKSV